MIRLVVFSLVSLSFAGCKPSNAQVPKKSNYSHDVEIAPDHWLTLKEERGRCWFVCDWNGQQVYWPGKRGSEDEEDQLPVTLREWKTRLYLIVLDRTDIRELKYIYLGLDKSGKGFEPIAAGDFPKQIATQNMLLDERDRFVSLPDKKVDSWELIRTLDVDHSVFRSSHTAYIWIEIETGKGSATVDNDMPDKDIETIVRAYKEKHHPIPLKNLVR